MNDVCSILSKQIYGFAVNLISTRHSRKQTKRATHPKRQGEAKLSLSSPEKAAKQMPMTKPIAAVAKMPETQIPITRALSIYPPG